MQILEIESVGLEQGAARCILTRTQDDSDAGHSQATVCLGGGQGECLINYEGQSGWAEWGVFC